MKNTIRLKNFFDQTPVADSKNFVAANINFLQTSYISEKRPLNIWVILSALIGVIAGMFTVLTENAIKLRKKYR